MGRKRITESQHLEIVERRKSGETIKDIAQSMGLSEYGVWSHSTGVIQDVKEIEPPCEDGELWAEIDGCDGMYLISSHGRVFSKGAGNSKARMLKTQRTKYGYDRISLIHEPQRPFVHRLVAEKFCDGRDENHNEVRHIDGNIHNNHAENLEWCEHGDKSQHIKHSHDGISIYQPLTDELSRKVMTSYHFGANPYDIARRYNISYEDVKECIKDTSRLSITATMLSMLLNDNGEEWREIEGYNGKYFVSSHGRVFSTGGKTRKGGLINVHTAKNGYQSVTLSESNDGKRAKGVPLHRLVALYFCEGHDEVNDVVNHIDGNPSNNHADNLEWCTQSHNVRHAINVLGRKIGGNCPPEVRKRMSEERTGKPGTVRRFTDDEVRAIRADPRSSRQVAKALGVNKSTIQKIRNGQTYSYVE